MSKVIVTNWNEVVGRWSTWISSVSTLVGFVYAALAAFLKVHLPAEDLAYVMMGVGTLTHVAQFTSQDHIRSAIVSVLANLPWRAQAPPTTDPTQEKPKP